MPEQEEVRPDLFDGDADPERWSNHAIGDKRLTWREAFERVDSERKRYQSMATTLTDLDRCEHGRHEGDVCGSCGGPSKGNPIMEAAGRPPLAQWEPRRIGTDLSGKPIIVPRRGERWAGEEPVPSHG